MNRVADQENSDTQDMALLNVSVLTIVLFGGFFKVPP